MDDSNLNHILGTLKDSAAGRTKFHQSWTQGRSAFGGLSAAFAVTAMRKLLSGPAEPQPLRSLLVSFIAPVPAGEVRVETRIQRQGKSVSQLAADLYADDALALQAVGIFGKPRKALNLPPSVRDDLPPKESGTPFAEETRRLPAFLQHFDGYWLDGAIPFSGNSRRQLALWLRHKTPLEGFPDERIVTMADMPPPVVLSYFTEPVNASSVTWALDFVLPPEEINDDWLYLEYTADAAADGYSQQSGAMYDESGRLCVLSRQCMVYFG